MSEQHPAIGVALHAGCKVPRMLKRFLAITEQERLLEEDPYTYVMLPRNCNTSINVDWTRFVCDLNRLESESVYSGPLDAWGLKLWKEKLPYWIVDVLHGYHRAFYEHLHRFLSGIQEEFGERFVVLSMHSYLQSRGVPEKSPDIDVCTWKADLGYWQSVIDRFIASLRNSDALGRRLSIGQNTRFEAYYFETWLAEYFPGCCCLATEVAKERFMTPDLCRAIPAKHTALRGMFYQAVATISH